MSDGLKHRKSSATLIDHPANFSTGFEMCPILRQVPRDSQLKGAETCRTSMLFGLLIIWTSLHLGVRTNSNSPMEKYLAAYPYVNASFFLPGSPCPNWTHLRATTWDSK
jgi:hypothetical protein